MDTVLVHRLSRRLLPTFAAALLAFTLLAGAGAATRVGAQPVPPGVDGVSGACRGLQDQANGLIAQYGAIGGADPSSDQLPGIIAQLQKPRDDLAADRLPGGIRQHHGTGDRPRTDRGRSVRDLPGGCRHDSGRTARRTDAHRRAITGGRRTHSAGLLVWPGRADGTNAHACVSYPFLFATGPRGIIIGRSRSSRRSAMRCRTIGRNNGGGERDAIHPYARGGAGGQKTSTRRVAKPMEVQAGRRTRPVGDFETTAVEIVTNARGDTRVKWRVGQTLAVQPGRTKQGVARIAIERIRHCERTGDINDEDARAEGFADAAEFCAVFARINGRSSLDAPCWALSFHLVTS